MKITFSGNQFIIEDDELVPRLVKINKHWPHLLEEYITMIIRNRERQLERIEVTQELRSRRDQRASEREKQ